MNGKYPMTGMNHRDAEQYVAALTPGTEMTLEREPDNKFDKFAVKVVHGGRHVGYIKAVSVRPLAIAMDAKNVPTITGKFSNNTWPCVIIEGEDR